MLSIFLIVSIIFTLLMLWRDVTVQKERNRVIDLITALSTKDNALVLNYQWRWKEYEAISHVKMVFQFWKPVGSYFKHSPCCYEINEKNKAARA